MKITIKYKKSRFPKDLSKITVLQDGLAMSLDKPYYVINGKYYYRDGFGQVSLVASSEAEFKSYLIDEELCKQPSMLKTLLDYLKE